MSNSDDVGGDIFSAIWHASGTSVRCGALVCSVLSLFLPAVTISTYGVVQQINLIDVVGWALIAPLSILAAIGVPAINATWRFASDILAAACALGVVAYVGLHWLVLVRRAAEASEGAGRLGGDEVWLGFGVVTMIVVAGLLIYQAIRG